jgi:hypothetical protein
VRMNPRSVRSLSVCALSGSHRRRPPPRGPMPGTGLFRPTTRTTGQDRSARGANRTGTVSLGGRGDSGTGRS